MSRNLISKRIFIDTIFKCSQWKTISATTECLNVRPDSKYSIICLFRIAVGPDEKFGLDRVRITEGFMFR